MLGGHLGTHSNQPQLAMWQVVAQSCAQVCGTSISLWVYLRLIKSKVSDVSMSLSMPVFFHFTRKWLILFFMIQKEQVVLLLK